MPVRLAMLSMAHVHARGYGQQIQRNPDAEIACVWDDDPARGRAGARLFEVPFADNLHEVLGDARIDGVVLNSETNKHGDLILAAAAAGKHVFTEKALTIGLEEADAVVAAVKQAGVKFMISLPQRSHPEALFLKRCIDDGLLGTITMMRARIAHAAALDRWFKEGSLWFGDEKLAGGGSLFDLGCHTVDAMLWFLGEPRCVHATIANYAGAYPIDDMAVAVVTFKSGAIGILDVSWVHRSGPNTWEVYGTEGFAGRGYPGSPVMLQSRSVSPLDLSGTFVPAKLPDPLPTPLDQWIAALTSGTEMRITIDDGRALTALLHGIYTSARTGRTYEFS